jgi:trimeric autotransporter adhesin
MSKRFRKCATAAVLSVAAFVSACGGGGGGSGSPPSAASLTVTSGAISVSATTTTPAPTATINANVSGASSAQYYFTATFTSNGIASISQTVTGTSVSFSVQFKSPTSLAPGTYSDTVTVQACEDSTCNNPVANSPQKVTTSYAVSDGAGAPAVLSGLAPSTVQVGTAGFALVVNGATFTSSSVVQWNGSARATSFISSTQLSALITAADVGALGTAVVTVANVSPTGTAVSNALDFSISATAPADNLTISTNALTATVDTSVGGVLPLKVVVTVNQSTQATYFYSVTFVGSAVAGISIGGETNFQPLGTPPPGPSAGRITGFASPGGGQMITGNFSGPVNSATQLTQLDVTLLNDAQMGAGTYADTIAITVCFDLQCTRPLPGSPQQIAVTYTVTGNPIPSTLFTLAPGALTVEAPTSSAAPVTATAMISTDGLPPYGAYVFATIGTGAAIASVAFQSNVNATGTLTVTAKPPASLGSGIYADSVQINICFDSACTKPANHGQFSLPITYVVDASASTDFTMQTIPAQIYSMAWSEVNQRIYATVPIGAASNPNSLIVVNPKTASIETVLSLGQGTDPSSLALSDDGQYAYVIEQTASEVVRVNLSTMSVDETIQIPGVSAGNIMKVPPGLPGSFAVETYNNTTALLLFDGTVQRPKAFSTGSLEAQLLYTWGADDTTLYAYDDTNVSGTMYQLAASSTGLATTKTTSGVNLADGEINDLQFANGLIYSSTGFVFNPATNSTQATFAMQNTNPAGTAVSSLEFAIDTTLNRGYFLTNDSPQGQIGQLTLEGFNLMTQKPTWIARFASPQILPTPLLRWGSNGLAFVTSSGATSSLTLISGSIVSR